MLQALDQIIKRLQADLEKEQRKLASFQQTTPDLPQVIVQCSRLKLAVILTCTYVRMSQVRSGKQTLFKYVYAHVRTCTWAVVSIHHSGNVHVHKQRMRVVYTYMLMYIIRMYTGSIREARTI